MRTFGEVAERLRRSAVQVFSEGRERGAGTGVVWSADGLVITNAHVTRSTEPAVELSDGTRMPARITSIDPRRDLAALRIPASALHAAAAGDSAAVRPGELVLAIGNPMGFAGALTTGVVHSVGPIPGMGRRSWIRTTARLAPGNSGGPLADAEGRVIGINTAIINGLGLAVPAGDVLEFLRRGARPRLGVTLRPVAYDQSRLGLLVLEVESGGVAEAASLRIGDILTGVNGRALDSLDALSDAIDAAVDAANGPLRLQFIRGDRSGIRETVARFAEQAEAA
jgi:serine protease Do